MARSKWIPKSAKPIAAKDTGVATLGLDAKKIGLENFGNTCYANSVLQALYFCTPFRDLILRDVDIESIPIPQTNSPVIAPVPTKPATPLLPQRWRPERKASMSGHVAEPSIPIPPPNIANPIALPPTLFAALQSLFLNISMSPGEKGTVAPRVFIDKLKELNPIFRSTMHQDAHEFLNYLLNQIMEEIGEERKQAQNSTNGEDLSSSIATLGSKIPPPTVLTAASSNSGTHPHDATLVHKLFEGVLTSETRCLTCETVSSRDESFLDLSIDIEQNSSVTACLRQFSASEMLCQRNKFFCDSCCDLQEAEKRMKIKKLPNVLALHLKRFKYQEDVERYIKLAYRVAFPIELRLFNTVDDMDDADRLYNLFAIVVHIGNGPHHGHYVSIIKTVGTWLVFDDDNVYPIPENDIPKYFGESNSGSAYVLYYQAADMDLSALGLRTPESQLPPESFINSMSPLQRSSGPNSHTPTLPPGLSTVNPAGVDLDVTQLSLSAPDTMPPPIQILPNQPTLVRPFVSIPTPETKEFARVVPTPMTPTEKDSSSLRRPPSVTAIRGTIASPDPSHNNGNDKRKSMTERSPRPSTSTPSFVASQTGSAQDEPPPIPPLPPNVLNHFQPPTLTASPTFVSQLSESDKESKSKSAMGWFLSKRKSLKVAKPDHPPNREIPASLMRVDELPHPHGNRYAATISNGSSSPALLGEPRRLPENGHADPSDSSTTETSDLSVAVAGSDIKPNGYDNGHPPESGVSSPASLSNNGQKYTNGSTSSGPHAELPPVRRSSLAPLSRTSVDRKRSLDFKALSSSTVSPASSPLAPPTSMLSSTTRAPLTPGRAHTYRPNINNGQIFANGVESPLKAQSPSPDSDVPSSPVTGFGIRPLSNTPLTPPTSLATSVGANASTSSANSASSNFKRATRKLSITAPMLGFGRRDKDKEREREKRASPSAANRF